MTKITQPQVEVNIKKLKDITIVLSGHFEKIELALGIRKFQFER